ncbi:transglutaminase [Salipiger pallidus]|uniref:Transglutaminase n=1 Tax=Salipiger pallidus TaxID=1775170 RepID=A0A8J3EEG6_9RHOB|nr:transglutaminase family protein [Salipiger pallidus]GGG63907.1 transglutaminase [Salipiger pallidus]
MRISIDVAMSYRFRRPNTAFLALEAAQTDGQVVETSQLDIPDATLTRIDGDADVGERIWAQFRSADMTLTYTATVDVTRPTQDLGALDAMPLHRIPGTAAPYLRPSRYCQSDKFQSFVSQRFGHLSGGAKVQGLRDWVEENLTYVPGSSDADTNVLETFAGRQGVCRDYAHLMCSLVRAAGIPARMVAVYSPHITPPDFHAVAEVWLSGQWWLVDATGMAAADSMAIIAVGRDAYDIAFMDSQEPAQMLSQSVNVSQA